MKMKPVAFFKVLRRGRGAPAGARGRDAASGAAALSSPHHGAADRRDAEGGDRWIGFVDFISHTVITGWCFDARNPDRSLVVEVVASNGKRLTAVAGQFRQDVKDAGYGTGNYGFRIDVATLGLKDEMLTIRFAESGVAINKVPLSLDPQLGLLEGRLPALVTGRMEALALETRTRFAEWEERERELHPR